MAEGLLKKDFRSIVDGLLGDLSSGRGGRVALTDTNEGSVVRTLVEAFSRELAVAYAQLEQVYELGYLGTARGQALDNVVALLGLSRRRGGSLQGTVTFSRTSPATGEISIPAGTRVAGKDLPPFETTVAAAFHPGDTEVTVPVRATAVPEGPLPEAALAPGVVNVMVRPLQGVDAVANRVRLVPPPADEDDEELRERARREVAASNLGTPSAIQRALRSLGLSRVEVQELPDRPGEVEVVVGDPGFDDTQPLWARAERAIEESRPAGVRVSLRGLTWVWIRITATVELDQNYPELELRALEAELQRSLRAYFDALPVGANVLESKVRTLLASHPKVLDVFPKPALADPAAGRLLEAFVVKNGVPRPETTDRRLTTGDIRVGTAERAGLRPTGEPDPFVLKLEPPGPLVYLDVELRLSGTVPDKAEDLLRVACQRYLDGLEAKPSARLLTAADLKEKLGELKGACAGLRVTVVHTRDGRVVRLEEPEDQDVLEVRERTRLRGTSVQGGA